METNKVFLTALGVVLVGAAVVGVTAYVIGSNNGDSVTQNEFSLNISSDDVETNITEDTYNQSFIYKSVYTFEVNCNFNDEEEKNYELDITYYLDNSITVTYSEGKVNLNELFDTKDSIKYLFNVTQNDNIFKVSFYDTISEIVEASLDLGEEIEVNFKYKVDQISLKFTCNENTINLHGYINESWYYYFEESQIIF